MITRSNTKVRQLKKSPRKLYNCEMCKQMKNNKPYELTLISFVGAEDTTLEVCRKCAYKETYGSKGMVHAMRENKIEQEKSN